MLEFPQDVGSLTACSIFGIIGGVVLCLFGWPLSFTHSEKKSLPADDERPAPRIELAFSVLNNHTVVGFCLWVFTLEMLCTVVWLSCRLASMQVVRGVCGHLCVVLRTE
jgi:hypothetical protein